VAKQPRAYLQWSLLDQSEDPVPWSTSDVKKLRDYYEKLSDAAEQAAKDMRRLEGDKLGKGDTVDALKELVNELPKYMDKAHDAYEKGYRALDKWETSLGTARMSSASIVRQAATAFDALEDSDAWKEKVDGEDPARDAFIKRLTRVLNDMNDAADECASALEEAKQGSPRKLWGWLDKIVTWVEENPLLYAVAMVVAGLAAIFIPGLGIALALTVLAISAATLHKEGKLGFNRESLFTLGMDALSLIPGGALLRGGRAVSRVAGQAATRVPGKLRSGVSNTATSLRNGAGWVASTKVGQLATNTTGGKIATSIVKDSAASMASSITVQVAGEGKSLSDINYAHEALTAVGTSAAGSTAGVLKDAATPTPTGTEPGSGGFTGREDGGGEDLTSTSDPDPANIGSSELGDNQGSGSENSGSNQGENGGQGTEGATSEGGRNASGEGTPPELTGPCANDSSSQPNASSAPFEPSGSNTMDPAPTADSDGGAPASVGADSAGAPASEGPDVRPSSTDDGPADPAPSTSDEPNTRDSEQGESNQANREEPREEFGPVTRSSAASSTPQPSNRPRSQIGDPDVDTSSGRSENSTGPESHKAGRAPEETSPQRNADDTETNTSGAQSREIISENAAIGNDNNRLAERGDIPVAAPVRYGNFGEFTDFRGPDGERTVSYRYIGSRPDGSDYTMNVTRDGANVNGTDVRSTRDGFRVAGADGSSARTDRGGVELTGPDGRGGASYRDGELTVSTSDGDVSASRDPNGREVRTDDGLTVRQDRNGDLRVSHVGDGPVRQRFDGDGPFVHRLGAEATGEVPPAQVYDPATGRQAQVGGDGYRVQTPHGSTHGYDRTDNSVRVESGDARAEVRPNSAGVSSTDRSVDIRLNADGTGSARGGGSEAFIRPDVVHVSGGDSAGVPDATLRQEADGRGGSRPVVRAGDFTAEPGRVGFDGGSRVEIGEIGGRDGRPGTRVIRVVEGGRERTYDMEGRPVGGGGAHEPLPRDPVTNRPYLPIGTPDNPSRAQVTIEAGAGTGTSRNEAALRVDGTDDWSVRTSHDGEMSMTPPGDNPDSVGVTRRPDGSTQVHTRESGYTVDNRDGITARAPGGLNGRTDGNNANVSDGSTVTSARTEESGRLQGERSAETRSESEPGRLYGDSSTHESSVSTREGTTVWTRGNEVHTTMGPNRQAGTILSGDRTVDVTNDGLRARGSGRDSDDWEVSVDRDGTRGDNGAQSIDVRARPEGDRVQSPVHRTDRGVGWGVRSPVRSPDQVSFRTGGDVEGTQRASGRTEVTDTNSGTTVRDARGGVRVESGGIQPDLRVTPHEVRVNAPDGSQQRVDLESLHGNPRTADPVRTDEGPTPQGQAGEGSAQSERGGSSARQDRSRITALRDTKQNVLQAVPFEVFKNVLNVVTGAAFDKLRYEMDWSADDLEFGPNGWPNPSYVVQSSMQIGTAIQKGAVDAHYGGEHGLPGFPSELAHQAMRNNLRDEYLEEHEEDFLEGKEVEKKLVLLNALLDEKVKGEYQRERKGLLSEGWLPPEELEQRRQEELRVDQFLRDAELEREELEAELAELYGVDVTDIEKLRD
jgi:hypothetical protein